MNNSPTDQATTDWRLVALLYGAGALAALQYAKMPWMLPGLSESYGLTPFTGALLLSMIGLAGLIGGTVAGAVAERLGETHTLRIGLVLAALSAAAMALPLGRDMLFAIRALESVSHMAIVVTVPTLMLAVAAPGDRARVMTVWSCYFVLTFIAAAVLAPLVDTITGWRGFAGLHALLLVVALFALHSHVRLDRRTHAIEATSARPSAPAQQGSGRPAIRRAATLWQAQRRLLGERRLLILPLTFSGYTLLFVALVSHLPAVLTDSETGRFLAGFALPACSLVGTIAALYLLRCGVIAWRLLAISATALLGLGATLAALLWYGSAYAGYVSLPVFACLGLLPAGVFSSLPDLFAAGDRDLSLVQGGLVQFGNLGNFSGPPILVAASGAIGDGAAGLFLIAGALFVILNLPELRREVAGV